MERQGRSQRTEVLTRSSCRCRRVTPCLLYVPWMWIEVELAGLRAYAGLQCALHHIPAHVMSSGIKPGIQRCLSVAEVLLGSCWKSPRFIADMFRYFSAGSAGCSRSWLTLYFGLCKFESDQSPCCEGCRMGSQPALRKEKTAIKTRARIRILSHCNIGSPDPIRNRDRECGKQRLLLYTSSREMHARPCTLDP